MNEVGMSLAFHSATKLASISCLLQLLAIFINKSYFQQVFEKLSKQLVKFKIRGSFSISGFATTNKIALKLTMSC